MRRGRGLRVRGAALPVVSAAANQCFLRLVIFLGAALQWSRLPLFGPSYTEVPSEEDEEGGEGTALLQDSQRDGSEGGGSPRVSAR